MHGGRSSDQHRWESARLRIVSDFRRIHLARLKVRFVEVLKLCALAGLSWVGTVASDRTKIEANVSRREAMGYRVSVFRIPDRQDPRLQLVEQNACIGSGFKWIFSSGFCERIPRPIERVFSRNRERLAAGAGGGNKHPCSPTRRRRNPLPGWLPHATGSSSFSFSRAARAQPCQRGIWITSPPEYTSAGTNGSPPNSGNKAQWGRDELYRSLKLCQAPPSMLRVVIQPPVHVLGFKRSMKPLQ